MASQFLYLLSSQHPAASRKYSLLLVSSSVSWWQYNQYILSLVRSFPAVFGRALHCFCNPFRAKGANPWLVCAGIF